MKILIFSLSMIITLGQAFAHTRTAKSFVDSDVEYFLPDMVPSGHLGVKVMQLKGFKGESLTKINQAFEVLEKVVNSEEFKDRVINFKNNKGQRAFASNSGLTNEEIYAKFMEGRETLQQDTPGEMNFYLRLYYKHCSRVIGYTSGKTNVISINRKYFKRYRPNEVAGNLAHEWTHKLGFDHRSASEHDSVPYAIGYIVEELAAKYLLTTSLPQIAFQR